MSLNPGKLFGNYLQKEMKATEETVEIAQYGLEVLLSTLGGLLAVLVIGAVLGVVPEALAAVIAVASLRIFAGGAHCSTAVRCALVSGLVFPGIGLLSCYSVDYLSPHIIFFLGVILVISLLTVYLMAPVDSPEKPILTERHRRKLRLLAKIAVIVIIGLMYIIHQSLPNASSLIVAAGFGLLWQCFVLTSAGHKLMAAMDSGLAKIT